ncbi:MAG: hypothetical protein V1921_09085 [Candidatus Altiarchaeota archaeon]
MVGGGMLKSVTAFLIGLTLMILGIRLSYGKRGLKAGVGIALIIAGFAIANVSTLEDIIRELTQPRVL